MLKWALTPRHNGDSFEHNDIDKSDSYVLLSLQTIIQQHQLPCLVRLMNDDINASIDNYCLLICETNDPYLIVSNETEHFSVPISFDGQNSLQVFDRENYTLKNKLYVYLPPTKSEDLGSQFVELRLFALVEHGVTRYSLLQSVRSLQSYLKLSSSSSSSFVFTHFTPLQPHMAYSNSALHRIHPGTLLQACTKPTTSTRSPLPPSNRLRTLFGNFPRSLNKHPPPNYQHARLVKNQTSSNDYFEVASNQDDEIFALKSDASGVFIPVYTQLPTTNSHHQSRFSPTLSLFLSNKIQGLYTVDLLSKLTSQYPFIIELIISRTLEENIATTAGYPFRRITLHRFVENHPRIIAFDMKNYAFIEIDIPNSIDKYAIENDNTLFQRYQAQLRWCHQHLSSFRSQIKTIVHSSNGIAMFVQATPFHGQQLQQYHQRRNSSSSFLSSPLVKHMPQTIFTSQESIALSRSRTHIPLSPKFHTTSNHSKYEQRQLHRGKTTGLSGAIRKDVRVYFNDPKVQKHLQVEHTLFNKQCSDYEINRTKNDNIDVDEENDISFQCTEL